jgi:serine/threonine protein kinase
MAILEQLTGRVIDEKYRIDRLIGQGGMGAVYLATHLGTKRQVAIKVIAPQFMANEEMVERFKREAEAAGRLRHPNVVNVTDFGFADMKSERLAYLVMEYLDGCTLGEMLKKERQLPLSLAVDILDQVCLAIDNAHRQGIIHRDLKPDNLWLEPNGRGGYNVKVLDFGLAKLRHDATIFSNPEAIDQNIASVQSSAEKISAVASATSLDVDFDAPTRIQFIKGGDTNGGFRDELTQANGQVVTAGRGDSQTASEWHTHVGALLGTPLYMSPEQACGETLDARADIYSLGVVAYQMLAGETPFTGNMYRLLLEHSDTPPPPLTDKRPDIPKSVGAVVMSALAKDPADRPVSAGAFATALRANTEGTGKILQRALVIYGEHFRKLNLITIATLTPLFALCLGNLVVLRLFRTNVLPESLGIVYGLLTDILYLFLASGIGNIVFAIMTQFLIQLFASPQEQVHIRSILAALKIRFRPLTTSVLLYSVYLTFLFWILSQLFSIPLYIIAAFKSASSDQILTNLMSINPIFFFIDSFLVVLTVSFWLKRYLLVPAVVMVEGWGGRRAFDRSKFLVDQAGSTVTHLILLTVTITNLLAIAFQLSMRQITGSTFSQSIKFLGFDTTNIVSTMLTIFLGIVVLVPIYITYVLLYLKARQAGGQTLNYIIHQQI